MTFDDAPETPPGGEPLRSAVDSGAMLGEQGDVTAYDSPSGSPNSVDKLARWSLFTERRLASDALRNSDRDRSSSDEPGRVVTAEQALSVVSCVLRDMGALPRIRGLPGRMLNLGALGGRPRGCCALPPARPALRPVAGPASSPRRIALCHPKMCAPPGPPGAPRAGKDNPGEAALESFGELQRLVQARRPRGPPFKQPLRPPAARASPSRRLLPQLRSQPLHAPSRPPHSGRLLPGGAASRPLARLRQ